MGIFTAAAKKGLSAANRAANPPAGNVPHPSADGKGVHLGLEKLKNFICSPTGIVVVIGLLILGHYAIKGYKAHHKS